MLDVKCKNAVTDTTSTLRCFICKATSAQFNNLRLLLANFPSNKENLMYGGVCDLHCWMRAFEAVNKLSDKKIVKRWRVTKKEEKEEVEVRKKRRNERYLSELNLVVDVPRAGGSGNSNTGNVARRAFQNEETFASITEVDQQLIHQIHMMLITINADHVVNQEAFKAYGHSTAQLWVDLYGWYNMPVTMHQLFFHAWESLQFSSLPLSYFSEQSLESCNKFFKSDRLHHARKDSRLHTIQDQFHRQSDKSDFVIAIKLSEKRKSQPSKHLPQDARNLLVIADSVDEEC